MGDFWSARFFSHVSSNLVGRNFFSSKKCHVFTFTECIYIYIVVYDQVMIAVIVLIWSCIALKCCKLYKIILKNEQIIFLCLIKLDSLNRKYYLDTVRASEPEI